MISQSIDVHLPTDAAFRVFTERVDLWWPRNHRMSGTPDGRMELSPPPNGELVEHAPDGRRLSYGAVQEWHPGERLVLSFFLGSGAAHPTEVTVHFRPLNEATRVTIEHRAGALSEEAFEGIADRFVSNWSVISQGYASYVAKPESP